MNKKEIYGYRITWKGCSTGRWRKYVEIAKTLPEKVTTIDELDSYIVNNPTQARTKWLMENMPKFIFDYLNGDHPVNFKIISIRKIFKK